MKNRPLALVVAAIGLVVSFVLVPLVPAQAAACTDPRFVTSDPNGMYFSGRYIVHNNMWNVDGYDVSETLSACSPSNWYVRATANNSSGDGAVKTYPNVHQDFHNWDTGAEPRLSTFTTIRSSFAARTPGFGIYNAAYDIWLNGVPGDHEVMIWTDNYKQVPVRQRDREGAEVRRAPVEGLRDGRQRVPRVRPQQAPDAGDAAPEEDALVARRTWPGSRRRHVGPDLLRLRDRVDRRSPGDVHRHGLLAEDPA